MPLCIGDLILQTDDDARPMPDWVEKIEHAHDTYPTAGVIGGDVIDSGGRSFLSRVADIATFPHYDKMYQVRNVPGVNSSYKKELTKQVGKYDISLFRGEDVDYNWRAFQMGWKILYIPDAKVLHIHRSTWYGLFYQHYMYGRAHYLVRNKWPKMYSHYPKRVDSFYSLCKWIASWSWFPFLDAFMKSIKMENQPNGFEILTLVLINFSHRIGTSVQKHLH